MKQILQNFWTTFFDKELELRVKIFNVIAMTGTLICFAMMILSAATDMISGVFINCAAAVVSLGILIYSLKSGKYQLCYSITILFVFFFLFTVLFVTGGGIHGGMPFFFVFAIVYTVYMLEGWWMLTVTAAELVLYSLLCVYAFYFPQNIQAFPTAQLSLVDMISGFLTVSVSLGATLYAQLHLYQAQQKQLIKARETAQTASQAKSAFLANMSHEIRTPIHIILGMNEMIHRQNPSSQIQEYSDRINKAGNLLLSLVDNVLDVSKIESGKMELILDRYKTQDLTDTLMLVGKSRCEDKGLHFSLNSQIHSEILYGDSVHIRQIAINLLSNAIKYTSSGSVTVRLYQTEAKNEGYTLLNMEVSDTGIGIRKEILPNLFDAFTRADLASHRTIEGTGLGLAIVRNLVDLMQGTICVESEYGKGSTFKVTIPQQLISEEDQKQEDTEITFTAPEARILVVDDHEENRMTMKALLAETLMQIDTAGSGKECLELVHQHHYHLILMDYMMEGMDGIETMHELHKIKGFDVPVIALTANVIAGTEEKLLKEGFTAFVGKPVPWARLEKILAEILPEELVTVTPVSRNSDTMKIPEGLKEQLQQAGMNLDEALHYFQGNLQQCAYTASIFIKYDQDEQNKAQILVSQKDCESLRFLVHALKGKAGNMGMATLRQVAAGMENLCKENKAEEMQSLAPYLFYQWTLARKALRILCDHVTVNTEEKNSYTLQDLPEMLHRMHRKPSLDCLDHLISQEKDPDALKQLNKIREAVMLVDFDQAEVLLNQLMQKKGE